MPISKARRLTRYVCQPTERASLRSTLLIRLYPVLIDRTDESATDRRDPCGIRARLGHSSERTTSAWVVNQVSNSISIVSVSKGIVLATIQAPTEPMDVVFAGGLAYVSASRTNKILVFNQTTLAQVASIPLYGDNPRALAVSPDGSKVYVAFALSGNGTTILPQTLAPPQSNPVNPALPSPPQVGLIIKWNDPTWSKDITYTMPDNDVAIIRTGSTPALAGYYSGVGTVNLGIAVNPVTGDVYVSNTDALNLTHFETNLVGHFVNNRITGIQASTGKITPYDLNPGINYSILPNPAALATALAASRRAWLSIRAAISCGWRPSEQTG